MKGKYLRGQRGLASYKSLYIIHGQIQLTVLDEICRRCWSTQLSDTTSPATISKQKTLKKSTAAVIVANFYARSRTAIFSIYFCADERQLLLLL